MENTSDQTLTHAVTNDRPTDYSHWIPEPEAAAYLNMSTRTLREWVRTRPDLAPERRLVAKPGRKPAPMYNPDDLKALRASRNPPRVQPASQETSTSLSPSVGHELGFLQALVTAADALGQRLLLPAPTSQSPAPLPLFLTIDQASEYSGLSRALLRRLCQSGLIAACKDGSWKIRRVDLENLAAPPNLPNGNGSH